MKLKNYTLSEQLGNGDVWRATRRGKEYAIKILPAGRTKREEFQREVQHLKRLRSSKGCPMHLVCYEDSWSDSDFHYLVTRYLPGVSGRELVKNILLGKIRLTPDQLLDILFDLSQAVEFIHNKGLAHRDIKPQNIQYNPDNGEVTLLDFGLACVLDECEGNRGGTPGYRAPEIPKRRVKDEAAVDIFSLGATFYYLLTGRDLFPGRRSEEIEQNVRRGKHLLVRTGSPQLNQLIVGMTSPTPKWRPTIQEVMDILQQIPDDPNLLLLSPV